MSSNRRIHATSNQIEVSSRNVDGFSGGTNYLLQSKCSRWRPMRISRSQISSMSSEFVLELRMTLFGFQTMRTQLNSYNFWFSFSHKLGIELDLVYCSYLKKLDVLRIWRNVAIVVSLSRCSVHHSNHLMEQNKTITRVLV